jgi:hypothetical protein
MAPVLCETLGLERMDAPAGFSTLPGSLRFLLSRSSVAPKNLVAPGPNAEEIRLLAASAITAPDHAALRPWRFIAFAAGGQRIA